LIENKIIKSGFVEWKKLIPFQNDNLKDMTKEDFEKLEKSIEKNGSLMAWTVWQDKDKIYLLDGVGRKLLYEEKEKKGENPHKKVYCNFLDLKNKKEAAKAVLILSSQYRKINDDGLNEFLNKNDLIKELPELITQIDIPEFDIDKFIESNFEIEEKNYPKESEKYNILITCNNEEDYIELQKILKLENQKTYEIYDIGQVKIISYNKFIKLYKN